MTGRTKQEVRGKLKTLHTDLGAGLRSPARYLVREAVEDWLSEGLDGRSERTRKLYVGLIGSLMEFIGSKALRELSVRDVRWALAELAPRFSDRSLQITRNCLERAITHAQANDLVGRNVAELVTLPKGRSGRPSKSFTMEQARALLVASTGSRLHGYITLSLMTGLRTEEARALRWDHVVTRADDAAAWQPVTATAFDAASSASGRFAVYVWRAERHGGDTKTGKSRRTLALPQRCVEALREQWDRQEQDRVRAGELWQEHGLVFASAIGTAMTVYNVLRDFRKITVRAGLGENWAPRELRHTFVSVLSASGVPVENIAMLAGHDRTSTTELVYRHEIRLALTQGAEVMDQIFGAKEANLAVIQP